MNIPFIYARVFSSLIYSFCHSFLVFLSTMEIEQCKKKVFPLVNFTKI